MVTDPTTERLDPVLGAYLRSARESAGFSLRDLGEMIGVSHVFLSEIERGLRKLPIERWSAVCRALPSVNIEGLAMAAVMTGPVMVNVRSEPAPIRTTVAAMIVKAATKASR